MPLPSILHNSYFELIPKKNHTDTVPVGREEPDLDRGVNKSEPSYCEDVVRLGRFAAEAVGLLAGNHPLVKWRFLIELFVILLLRLSRRVL